MHAHTCASTAVLFAAVPDAALAPDLFAVLGCVPTAARCSCTYRHADDTLLTHNPEICSCKPCCSGPENWHQLYVLCKQAR